MELYQEDKKYKNMGLVCMPINGNTKKPLIKEWKPFESRRPTDDELKKWFDGKDVGVALIHGHLSGTLAVDFDTYKKEFGNIPYTPVRVKTPRGGSHGIYKFNSAFTNSVNADIAVDIRSEGAYTGIPPTINKTLGKGYEWDLDGELSELLKALPELPEEVYQQIKKYPNSETFNSSDYLKVEEGGRNDALYRHACSQLGKGVDPITALAAVQGINRGFSKPLSEYEVQQLFKSAMEFVESDKVNSAKPAEFN